MDLSQRRDARTFSRAMMLRGGPISLEAEALVAELVDKIIAPFREAKGQLRPTTVVKYVAVTGPFLADLLLAAAGGRWSKRETNTNALTGVPGGATAFKTMRAALGAAGLLEELPGYIRTEEVFGFQQVRSARTSFRPSPALLALAAKHGIALSNVSEHFSSGRVIPPPATEVLEARAERQTKGQPGRKLQVDLADPKAAAIVAGLRRLNDHLMQPGRITGITFAGLRRVFSNADRPDFEWQWHGRYYSMPEADGYEYMEGGAASRTQAIKIDGAPASAVDISASHLTILHGLLGLHFDPSSDPYEVDGEAREQVKQWLLLALGSSDPNIGGPRFSRVRTAVIERYPFLADLASLGIGTLDLQFHEAEIMRLAMEDLVERGVGFLPVHDELMVARGHEEIAEDALRRAFERYFEETLNLRPPVPRLSSTG